jgi:hypothetical protein
MGHLVLAGAQFKMEWLVKKIVLIQMGWLVILERVSIPLNIMYHLKWSSQ